LRKFESSEKDCLVASIGMLGIFFAFLVSGCSSKYTRERKIEPPKELQGLMNPEQVTAGNASNFAPDLSPNGAFVVFTSDVFGNKELVEKRSIGGRVERLTWHSADDFAPAVSPDGKRVAFVSRREDAAGDIHILALGFNPTSLLGFKEARVDVISSKQTEDSHPSWFPDGARVVFASRAPGDRLPQIMWADLKDGKPQPLGDAKGDQPSVSPDGTKIVWVRDGAIWLWDVEKEKSAQLTIGGLVQDGQPRFNSDGSKITFVRYLDDTNRDQRLDGNDRPSIWVMDISRHVGQPAAESFAIVPLTGSSFASYAPHLRADWLYFTLQTSDSLDIFRLPSWGQIRIPSSDPEVLRVIDAIQDPSERLFVVRRVTVERFLAGDSDSAQRWALHELNLHASQGRSIEAGWLFDKISRSFAQSADTKALADLEMIRLSVARFAWPEVRRTLTERENRILVRARTSVEKVQGSARVSAQRDLLLAAILSSEGKFSDAAHILRSVAKEYHAVDEAVANARFGLAQLATVLSGRAEALRQLRDLVRDFSDNRAFVRKVSAEAVRIASESDDNETGLVALREMSSGLVILPAEAHLRIARRHLEEGRSAVAANELREVTTSYAESPEVVLSAAAELSRLEEEAGRHGEAEAMLRRVLEGVTKESPTLGMQARTALIDFHVRRGEALLRAKEPGMAAKEYRKVLELDPLDLNAHRGVIDALWRRKALEEHLRELETLAEDNPRSAVHQYILGYALTYGIDDAKTPAAKLDAVNTALVHVERARDLNSQNLHIQQTLGWLWLQKAAWTDKFRSSGSFSGRVSTKMSLAQGFVGFEEPNWLELAVDAFLNAHWLSRPNSVERANLSLNLAQTWYDLNNFPKALRFYMERIRMLSMIPLRDPAAEALIWRRAGRAAFASEELSLAEALQKRALASWEALGNESETAYSLDALALTLGEQKKYPEAMSVYQRLLQIHKARGDQSNVLNTSVNLGWIAMQGGDHPTSLVWFEEALRLSDLMGQSDRKPDQKDSAITVDLGGQGSAAKGFDLQTQRMLILSLRSQVFERTGRLDLACLDQEERVRLMIDQRKGLDRSDKKWIEDISIAQNKIASMRLQLGQHKQAVNLFSDAKITASALRPPKQSWLSREEWINEVNEERVKIRMAAVGALDSDEIAKSKTLVDQRIREFQEAIDSGAQSELRPFARYASLQTSWSTVLGEELDPRLTFNSLVQGAPPKKHVEGAVLALRSRRLAPNPESTYAASVREFRRRTATESDRSWRLALADGNLLSAFERLERHVALGGRLEFPVDHLVARDLTERLIRAESNPEARLLLLRRFASIRHIELAREIWEKPPEHVLRGSEIKPPLEISDSLDSGEVWIMAWQHRSEDHVELFCGKPGSSTLSVEAGSIDAAVGMLKAQECFSGAARLWMIPLFETASLDWNEKLANAANHPGLEVSLVSSPDLIPAFAKMQRIAKASLVVFDGPGEVGESTASAIVTANPGLSVERRSNFATSGLLGAERFNIIHLGHEGVIPSIPSWLGVFRGRGPSGGVHYTSDLKLRDLATMDLNSTTLLVLGNSSVDANSLGQKGEGWNHIPVLSLLALGMRVPTIILPRASRLDAEQWREFYTNVSSASVAEAVARTRFRVDLIGYGGVPVAKEMAFARARIDQAIEDAEIAFDDENWTQAAAYYKEAVWYADKIGRQEVIDSLLDGAIKSLFAAKDYRGALHFQMILANRLKSRDDPFDHAEATQDAGILAMRAEDYEKALTLLDEADGVFSAEDEYPSLAKSWHYRALIREAQRRFEDTVAAYEKSREFFELASDELSAADKLLAIGNVYKEGMANYPAALDYYDRALKALEKLDRKDLILAVQIDRANTLVVSGEVKWAIGVLEKHVVGQVDRKRDLRSWIRARQILANAWFRAGMFQNASDINREVLSAAGDIKNDIDRAVIVIDGKNLEAMIRAKLGDLAQAFVIFDEAVSLALSHNLRSKQALLYNNIGYWTREAGRVKDSIDWFDRALQIDRELQARADIAFDLRNLGLSVLLLGDLPRAKSLLDEALALSLEMNIPYNVVWCHFGLGDLALKQGRRDLAKAAYEAALAESKKSWLQDFVWRGYAGIGSLQMAEGNLSSAEDMFRRAVDVIEELRAGLKSESSRSGFQADRGVQSVYTDFVKTLMMRAKYEEAWRVSERARARAFIDSLGNQEMRFSSPEAALLFDRERRAKSELELAQRKLQIASLSDSDRSSATKAVEEARKVHDSILRELKSKNPQLGQFVVVDAVTLSEITQLIPENSALVEYMIGEAEVFVWVIRDGVISGHTVKTDANRLRAAVDEYRTLMQNWSTTTHIAKELGSILIEPIADRIRGVERLVIVPHDVLHYLAFAALPWGTGWLVDEFSMSYLESATVARFVGGKIEIGASTPVLAVGNPSIGKHMNLPFAEREAKSLGRWYTKLTLALGDEATESLLRGAGQSKKILHIASHGEFNPKAPAESRLLLTSDKENDGNLTIEEIFGLRLEADLVTLSACETGLGQLASGDEIIGMNRAFFYAGAKSLVSSLWRISDVSSAVIMKRFYRNLAAGISLDRALQKAQKDVRQYYPHPAYWAAFRLLGNAG
jgi:CHAT domain-containing protein/Tol biopolymer transport system component/Tfp pilus assembly protein PilF